MTASFFRLRELTSQSSRTFRLVPGEHGVGSSRTNSLVLDDLGVSRRHALIRVREEWIAVEDLASKNGTWVNGERTSSAELRPGDEVRFGETRLRLEAAPRESAALAIRLARLEISSTRSAGAATPSLHDARPGLEFPPGHAVLRSPEMRRIYRQMEVSRDSDLPVLIHGETGVGKEPLARTVHLSSRRRGGPWVALNCAAIPAELLEAELFGIGRGVATGVASRHGRFRRAAGGTLFLDEVGELPLDMQAKLLRVLQEKEVQPLGSDPVAIDVRIVAATNADLERRITEGAFRADLYYRLAGIVLDVPPLRQRPEDVPRLVEHFLAAACRKSSKFIEGVSSAALEALQNHPWPGNVRQLEHEIHRLVLLCPHRQAIDAELLPASIRGSRPPEQPLLTLDLAELERRAIRQALERSGGQLGRAAELLGISRFALRRRRERLNSRSV